MKLENISPGEKKQVKLELDLSELDFFGSKPFVNPVLAEGYIENKSEYFKLTSQVKTTLQYVCDRCLETFTKDLNSEVSAVLADELQDDENDEIYLLQNGCCDIREIIASSLIINMDTKILCKEGCKGLCQKCGHNLNLSPCDCGKDIDPRWSALSKL